MASQPPPTLYLNPGSYSLVAHSLLLHYDIPFTPIPMSASTTRLSTGSHWVAADGSLTHEQYRAIVPTGLVPALVIGTGADSTTITEMPAVLTYIALQKPHLKLLGEGPLEKAKIAEWMAWLSETVHCLGFAGFIREGRFVDDEAVFPVVKRRAAEVIEQSFKTIDGRLEGREFAVGGRLTVVDFNLYPFWRWALKTGFEMGRYPTYAGYIKRIEALDGVRKMLVAEGLAPCF
ncbi:glutathione S-transferase family protein [Candidatus Bathyarchaeota archaeon]|nr:glutathione S-transferase family protein [Candidatus Bathyarchaeota archaeon]